MPKEVIHHSVMPNNDITVGWEKGKDVQVGVGVPNYFRFTDKHGEPLPDEGELYSSLWFVFDDREQINRLIRHLRKARDAAFGKDE